MAEERDWAGGSVCVLILLVLLHTPSLHLDSVKLFDLYSGITIASDIACHQ